MWIMTKYGFFSIVSAWTDQTDQTPHPDNLMIRARKKDHLENLLDNYSALTDCEILETASTDYKYRIITDKNIASSVLNDLVNSIDYINFKDECHRARPEDQEYETFLHQVWYSGVQMDNSK